MSGSRTKQREYRQVIFGVRGSEHVKVVTKEMPFPVGIPADAAVGLVVDPVALTVPDALFQAVAGVGLTLSLSYGLDHEHTAYIYNNIGAVYSENGQPEKALPEHEHALKIYETYYPDHKNLDLAQTHADLADAYLRIGDLDKVMYHLNESFAIYDQLLPENAHQYLSVCSTLAKLLVAAEDYKTAEEQYSHVIWLMLENGYEEDSQAVREFNERVLEVRRMAQNGSK